MVGHRPDPGEIRDFPPDNDLVLIGKSMTPAPVDSWSWVAGGAGRLTASVALVGGVLERALEQVAGVAQLALVDRAAALRELLLRLAEAAGSAAPRPSGEVRTCTTSPSQRPTWRSIERWPRRSVYDHWIWRHSAPSVSSSADQAR